MYVYEYLSSCAVGVERIFTCTCESFLFETRVQNNGLLLTKRYVPPSEGKSCKCIYRYVGHVSATSQI